MAKPYNDAKLRLGEPAASMLRDFCMANYRGAAIEVIREAVVEHINRRLESPDMRERYQAARKERLGLPAKIVKLAINGDKT
jgi:hypothetical protein